MEDLISRQESIKKAETLFKTLSKEYIDMMGIGYNHAVADCIGTLKHLPVVQERKKGTWIGTEYDGYADGAPVYYEWECSECGCIAENDEPTWNYCPYCGADMRKDGEQDG